MKTLEIIIDNILWIKWEWESKLFAHEIWWQTIKSEDFNVIAYNKKVFSIRNWKDLWSNMMIPIKKSDITKKYVFDKSSFLAWLWIFWNFDEVTWKTAHTIYKASQQKKSEIVKIMDWVDLNENYKLSDTFLEISNFTAIKNIAELYDKESELVSFIFWIFCGYWQFSVQGEVLSNIKCAIPVVGSIWMIYDDLVKIPDILRNRWIVMNQSILETKFGNIIQWSSNDSDLLSVFLPIVNLVEKANKISKLEQSNKLASELKQFATENAINTSIWFEQIKFVTID